MQPSLTVMPTRRRLMRTWKLRRRKARFSNNNTVGDPHDQDLHRRRRDGQRFCRRSSFSWCLQSSRLWTPASPRSLTRSSWPSRPNTGVFSIRSTCPISTDFTHPVGRCRTRACRHDSGAATAILGWRAVAPHPAFSRDHDNGEDAGPSRGTLGPQVGFEPDNPSIHSMNSRTRQSVSVPLVNPALLGSPGTYTAKVLMTGGATMQAIRCQLLDRAQLA